jgi:hypothetical protein
VCLCVPGCRALGKKRCRQCRLISRRAQWFFAIDHAPYMANRKKKKTKILNPLDVWGRTTSQFFLNFWCVCATSRPLAGQNGCAPHNSSLVSRRIFGLSHGGDLKKKKRPGEVWEKVWKRIEGIKYIHARIASRRATLICFGEKTLSRGYRPIQSFREDIRRKEEKMENKSDFIYHHGTWGKKERRELLLWYVLPRGRLITVNVYK